MVTISDYFDLFAPRPISYCETAGICSTNDQKSVTPGELHFSVSATEDPDRPYGHVVLHRSATRLRMSDRKYSISKLLDPRERGEKVDLNVVLARLERHTPFV